MQCAVTEANCSAKKTASWHQCANWY